MRANASSVSWLLKSAQQGNIYAKNALEPTVTGNVFGSSKEFSMALEKNYIN